MVRGLVLVVLMVLGLTSAPDGVRAEPRVALVIANGDYDSDMGSLPNPVNDGKLIAQSLKKVDFSVTLVTNGDQKAMKRAISDFGLALTHAGPGSTGLFYYAGHGIQVGGINYLVPVSAVLRSEADVDLETVAAEAVLRAMEFSGTQVSIIVLDACRNNPLARNLRSGTRGLARMDAPTGSFVAYSTAPGDVAVDGQGDNSPFASAVAREVQKPGQSIEETFRNVRGSVMAATGKAQVPWDSSSLTAPFYFRTMESVAISAASPSEAPAPVPTAVKSTETLFWESIMASRRASDFEAYLKKFPNGDFADLARLRAVEFREAPAAAAVPVIAEEAPEPVAALPAPPPADPVASTGGSLEIRPGDVFTIEYKFKFGARAVGVLRVDDTGDAGALEGTLTFDYTEDGKTYHMREHIEIEEEGDRARLRGSNPRGDLSVGYSADSFFLTRLRPGVYEGNVSSMGGAGTGPATMIRQSQAN